MTRRNFIRHSASAFALFSIVPRHVIAGSGMTPPSEQVTMLAIGAGGPKPGSDFAYAGMMTQCSLTGVAALFDAGRTLRWNKTTAAFDDSPNANARLTAQRIAWPA